MQRSAALFSIALALGAIILVPRDGAQAQGARERPIAIETCQTISASGSYKLVNNLTFTGPAGGTCLPITADFVTIDLAGFTISNTSASATAITAGRDTTGIAVRNGSISNFISGVNLGGQGSVVEGLRVFGPGSVLVGLGGAVGIAATGIVKGNTVLGVNGGPLQGTGIVATGIVTGNYADENRIIGIQIGQGSTVIGNTVTQTGLGHFDGVAGIFVDCPSNVTGNMAVNNNGSGGNLVLNGEGCNNTNNVAP